MRKVFIICSTLVLVFMMALPGSALSYDYTPWYTNLQFDTIGFIESDDVVKTYPWPYNFGNIRDETFSFDDGYFQGWRRVTDTDFGSGHIYDLEGEFPFFTDKFVLTASDLFLKPQELIGENFQLCIGPAPGTLEGVEELFWTSVTFKIKLGTMEVNSDRRYELVLHEQEFTYEFERLSVEIGKLLMSSISQMGVIDDASYDPFYIDELSVELEFCNEGMNTPYVAVFADNLDSDDNADGVWFWFSRHWFFADPPGAVIPPSDTDTDGFNLGSFLADSVSAFLSAEIVPGLSLDRIFYFVMICGILLWFVKLVS